MTVSNTKMTAYGVPMVSLMGMLEGRVQRNVIDNTGLTGKYDFRLKWRFEEGSPINYTNDQSPSLFTALQEDLGLRLEPSKVPVDTLVVGHIEPPSQD